MKPALLLGLVFRFLHWLVGRLPLPSPLSGLRGQSATGRRGSERRGPQGAPPRAKARVLLLSQSLSQGPQGPGQDGDYSPAAFLKSLEKLVLLYIMSLGLDVPTLKKNMYFY